MRSHLLEVNGGVEGGRLRMAWTYSRNLHERSTIERVAGDFLTSLRGLIEHCRSAEAGGCTPSDFPLAGLDQAALDRLVGTDRGIEDLYPLSPLQSGLLFHTLYSPESGVYFEQISCTLEGSLDVAAYREAWRQVVERHPILRTSFVWDGLPRPLQLVHRRVDLAWEERDWRGLSEEEQSSRLAQHLEEDRERGFELSRAPLMRWTMIRLGERQWRFVWSHHHLLLDGWSMPLLLKEVLMDYEGRIRGVTLPVERPRPYRDYIGWLGDQDVAAAESYWRMALGGFTTPTPLVVDRPVGSAGESGEYTEHRSSLSAETTDRLERWARSHQLTLNTLVQGAWALLLSRYSGERDVVFGATVSGRSAPLAGIESMLGLFINTLPVRVHVEGGSPLLSWLQGIQEQQAELRQHESSSLVQVQGWSDVSRGQSLFESLLVFENYPIDETLQRRGSELSIVDVQYQERTNYPLTLIAAPGEGLSLRLLYDGRRFSQETIERLLGHLESLFEGMAAEAEVRVSDLGLLGEAERRQVLSEWNATESTARSAATIHGLFAEQASRTPEAVALRHGDRSLTYGELDERSNRLAHYLRSLGVGPEVGVGLCVERSPEMVVGLLGILKAGGAYVPLDPGYPSERLAFMLEDSSAPVLVTEAGLVERLPADGSQVVLLDGDWEERIAAQPGGAVESPATAANLAYVIYTSGSTGRPKGVAIAHGSTAELLGWASGIYTAEELSGVLASTSICFDLSVFELFLPLSVGGTVIVADNALALSSLETSEAVTLVNTVPSALEELLRVGGLPPSVRTVNLAGEPLRTPLVQGIYEQGVERVYDLYGPSEDTTYSTWSLRSAEGPETIGRPIRNTRSYILDDELEPVPAGVPGELYLAGEGLARGYLGRPDLTADRFVPDPYGEGNGGGRLYRTGDRCRWLADGRIEFLGRLDRQVKLRGYRIELGEIEAALGGVSGVRESVALVREDAPGDRRLVGYVVSREPGACPGASELRR
jgi:amino acid adenylation domain-containing protein